MRDPEVPEVHRAAHQKSALPKVGTGTCPGPGQDECPFSERSHYGTARGLGGLPSGPP